MTFEDDDGINRMPWTHRQITIAEFEQWVASRKEAGRGIDIEICERAAWPAYDCDPYGLRERKGDLPEEMQQVGTNRFVRSPESSGWIWEGDLPVEKAKAMYDRIHREYEAYKALEKQFAAAANTLKLKDETDHGTRMKSSWDAAWIIRAAIREFTVGKGVLDVGTIQHFVGCALEAGIVSGRNRSR